MVDALRTLFTRRQDTNKVTARGAPDLGIALLAPGINAQPVQVASTQNVQEPQPAVVTPVEIIPLPEEIVIEEPAEDEAAWNRRMRVDAGLPAEQPQVRS